MRIVRLLAVVACLVPLQAYAQSIDSEQPVIVDIGDFQPSSTGIPSYPVGEQSAAMLLGSPPTGDTYSGTPSVQNTTTSYGMLNPITFISTFDNIPETAGPNLVGAPGDTIETNDFLDPSGNTITVKTSWLNRNSGGTASNIIGPGVVSPTGAPYSRLRLNVGYDDPIDVPGYGYVAGTGKVRYFDGVGVLEFDLVNLPPPGSNFLVGDKTIQASSGNIADAGIVAVEYRWDVKRLPSVTSVTPGSGPVGGGQSVVVNGNYFEAGATVSFSGSPCTSAVVTSATAISCTTSASAAGLVNVTVTNSGTHSGIGANLYQYVAAPTPLSIVSVTPSSGPLAGGNTVFVAGDGFVSGTSVSFGGSACTNVNVGLPTFLSCTAPAGTGVVDVTVSNPDSQSATLAGGYAYMAPAPTINSITPNSGPTVGGTYVSISGSGFQTGFVARFGGVACTATVFGSSSSIACNAPAGAAGSVDVSVTNPDAQSAVLANGYTYTFVPLTISTVSPVSGPAAGGNQVVVSGGGIAAGASVSIGGSPCTNVFVAPPGYLSCTAPAGTGVVDVIISNPDAQSATLAGGYTYIAPSPIVVDTLDDTQIADGLCSLREAVTAANTNTATLGCASGTGADIIRFNPSLHGGTISLSSGQLTVTESLSIQGPGADQLTVSGNDLSRVFLFNTAGVHSLSDLTIADGNGGASEGGGIRVVGANVMLTVSRTTIRTSLANGGGGIAVLGGPIVEITESALIDNSATFSGAGLLVDSAQVTLINTTVSGGVSGSSGVMNQGPSTLAIRYSTIADVPGIAVRNVAFAGQTAVTTFEGSIFANSPNLNFFADGAGNTLLTSLGNNIANDATGGLTASGDQPDTNPMIGPLTDNGGGTLSRALLAGSPAINNAPSATCPPIDQRVFSRTDGNCDVGAVEFGAIADAIFSDGFDN